jgi:hypothetical protein
VQRGVDGDPAVSANDDRAPELRDGLRRRVGALPGAAFKESDRGTRVRGAGLGPDDLDCAEVYDLSTAMELDWYEQIGLCAPG